MTPTRSTYAAQELGDQLDRGPYEGEDFFRLQVSGNGQTKHVNITREQLEKIIAVCDAPES